MGKILVTGASGFIGSNLINELLKQNVDIIGLDKQEIQKDRQHIKNSIVFIKDDINNIEQYNDILKDIDIVYHLAASADIRKSFQQPLINLSDNVIGTSSLLEFIRKKDVKKLIFASSSAVYGIRKDIPTKENAAEFKPISVYGSSKLANEAYVYSYSHLYNIKIWGFRFAQVVGKYESRGVIYDFVNKLKKNPNKLEILGDGNQTKSYFDVSDCVNGFINIPKIDNNKSVEFYNLANTETIKIVDLAKIVCNEMHLSPKFTFTGGDRGWKGDTPFCIIDIEKALKLGWKPKIDCETAIRRTVRELNVSK